MTARLYDGHSTRCREVTLYFTQGKLLLDSKGQTSAYPLESLRFSDRLGDMPRSIYLPDGTTCESDDNDAIDAFLKNTKSHAGSRLLHRFESKLKYVAAAMVATLGFTYLFITYGLPSVAKHAAMEMPAPVVYHLGSGTLSTLDKLVLAPTTLPLKRQNELHDYFSRYIDKQREWPRIKLLFRSGKIGANALALPDGTVIFTDDLVRLADDDRELLGIFFHEIGHIEERHALRSVLQDSAFYLLVSALTGDVTTASSILAALPTALVESGYSRDMEDEADTHAYDMMQRHGIPHEYFAAILEKILQKQGVSDEQEFAYLSSHPMTRSRIERFRHTQ